MYEILARGKRKDNNKWVKGYLVEQDKPIYRAYIITSIEIGADGKYAGIAGYNIVEVIPETVGRCTGLTDRNKKQIFENDIVRHHKNIDVDYLDDDIGHIFWSKSNAKFLRTSASSFEEYFELSDRCDYEIIGNAYDNPELLAKI